jgi:hypothetical protein
MSWQGTEGSAIKHGGGCGSAGDGGGGAGVFDSPTLIQVGLVSCGHDSHFGVPTVATPLLAPCTRVLRTRWRSARTGGSEGAATAARRNLVHRDNTSLLEGQLQN